MDFPLSDTRWELLTELFDGVRVDDRYSQHTLAWGRKAGFIERLHSDEPPHETYHLITDAGRRALKVDTLHQPAVYSRLLGHSPIKGFPSSYGTTLRCRCGWKTENNEARTKGGEKRAREAHREHMTKMFENTEELS